MAFIDKTFVCKDCNKQFTFTAGEQEFYQQKGLVNDPRRCPECRAARRRSAAATGGPPTRQVYDAVCVSCGAATQVPFEPRQNRPVYCTDCFSKRRAGTK